jgi:hypothetical protein
MPTTEGVNQQDYQLKHVANAFVASSKPMIRELRRSMKVLDELGLQFRQSGYHQWRSNLLTHYHVVSHLETKQ